MNVWTSWSFFLKPLIQRLPTSIPIKGFNGAHSRPITDYTLLNLTVDKRLQSFTPFLITNLGNHSIILGCTWLAEHQVLLNTAHRRLIWPNDYPPTVSYSHTIEITDLRTKQTSAWHQHDANRRDAALNGYWQACRVDPSIQIPSIDVLHPTDYPASPRFTTLLLLFLYPTRKTKTYLALKVLASPKTSNVLLHLWIQNSQFPSSSLRPWRLLRHDIDTLPRFPALTRKKWSRSTPFQVQHSIWPASETLAMKCFLSLYMSLISWFLSKQKKPPKQPQSTLWPKSLLTYWPPYYGEDAKYLT